MKNFLLTFCTTKIEPKRLCSVSINSNPHSVAGDGRLIVRNNVLFAIFVQSIRYESNWMNEMFSPRMWWKESKSVRKGFIIITDSTPIWLFIQDQYMNIISGHRPYQKDLEISSNFKNSIHFHTIDLLDWIQQFRLVF